MIGRLPVAVLAVAGGIAVASLVPEIPRAVRDGIGLVVGADRMRAGEPAEEGEQHKSKGDSRNEGEDERQASVRLTANQIETAGIELAAAQDGTLTHRIVVPGTIVPHADRIARVSVRLPAMVTELRKMLGEHVDKGEIVAVLESREVADAKSDYLAARLNNDLQQDLFEREKALWDKRISSEQQWLRARNATATAKMRFDIARQKLFALGVTASEIGGLPEQPETTLRRHEVLAPMSGRIVDRKVELGTIVGRDNLETELFAIADLDRVWVELAVSPTDLPTIKEGQTVSVAAHGLSKRAVGTIVFISPMLDRDTHSARVVTEIANPDGNWRPGSLVHATIDIEVRSAPVAVPASAVQTIGKTHVVFVRTPDGFERRAVALGESDNRIIEILSGLRAGEQIAVTNTFALKAEFLKSLAED
jgi:membrane fusion protein, heavy metal efflux system